MNLDGASDSKPALEVVQEHPTTQKSEHKPTKLRRFMSTGSRGSKALSRPDMSVKASNTPPMQTLSPRPTEYEPWAKKQTKRSISTFLLTRTFSTKGTEPLKGKDNVGTTGGHRPATESASLTSPPATVRGDGVGPESQGRLPVTSIPYQSVQSQPREDSAMKSYYDTALLASRTAALTSHPVEKEDLENEEFTTPKEFSGRQTGDYVEK